MCQHKNYQIEPELQYTISPEDKQLDICDSKTIFTCLDCGDVKSIVGPLILIYKDGLMVTNPWEL